MKTTIEISDTLLADAKRIATRDGVTLRALVESGLRREIQERKAASPRFRLRDAGFRGKGLHPDIQDLSWSEIRELVYTSNRR